MSAVWQGRFISDAAISSAVSAARWAVGDTGQLQRVLNTIHGRGFRFAAPVRELAEDSDRSFVPLGLRRVTGR